MDLPIIETPPSGQRSEQDITILPAASPDKEPNPSDIIANGESLSNIILREDDRIRISTEELPREATEEPSQESSQKSSSREPSRELSEDSQSDGQEYKELLTKVRDRALYILPAY